ncbi:MAG: ribonuclease P protein component [Anaerolineae bacterium]|nr:ribonuclease P protein component [Anaerolineae bacterium]
MKKVYRLRKNEQFHTVRSKGRSWANRWLVLCALPNDLPYSRFGFTVSRRVGSAVVRNRARRLLREAVRLRRETIAPGWDLVFVARAPMKEAAFHEVDRAVEQLLRRARLLLPDPDDEESQERVKKDEE